MTNAEFRRYERSNFIRSQVNRLWNFMENHGFPGTVDRKSVGTVYAGRQVLGDAEANAFIKSRLNDDGGFMASRFGAVELNYIYYYLRKQMGNSNDIKRRDSLRMLCFNAGFFPQDEELADKLAEMYLNSAAEMDLCGAWSLFMEDYILSKYSENSKITKLRFLEPWTTSYGEPWTKALEGKKVLVIHPFAESMNRQYERRTLLFQNVFREDEILPVMDIKYIKAVQSIGGQGVVGFADWFEALDHMLVEIGKIDFEVAVLGCGAYGFPLAAEIKRMGKKAIHLGGATQLWFGIKGKRWNDDPLINRFYNEFWISPSDAEKPANADKVEGGCYW